jgi:hypothetical protein
MLPMFLVPALASFFYTLFSRFTSMGNSSNFYFLFHSYFLFTSLLLYQAIKFGLQLRVKTVQNVHSTVNISLIIISVRD